MKISAVQNNSIQNNSANKQNFKSKLPNAYCKCARLTERDFWGEFTQKCMQENKQDKLADLLRKLTSNFDKNVLALTAERSYRYGSDIPSGKLVTDSYTFSLQKSADKIDNQEAINSRIFVCDKYYDSNHEDFAGRYISEDTDATEQDSLTDALLKVLRDIVTPNTHCNRKIYGGKDTKEEHFLKDFRA